MSNNPFSDLLSIARHEAAHAIGHMMLTPSTLVESVTIGDNERGPLCQGICRFERMKEIDELSHDERVAEAIVCLVGPLAEFFDSDFVPDDEIRLVDIFYNDGAGMSDLENAGSVLGCTEDELTPIIEQAQLFVEENIPKIRALAAELHKRGTMTGEEILEFLS